MLLGEWLHGFRLDFLEHRKRWQIKLYGLSFLHSVWDNTLMTFSQALVSKAWSIWERKLLWDKNSCGVQWHFWEGQVRSHPISHFLDPRWERHYGLTMQELCPTYRWAVCHLFCPSRLFSPSHMAWQVPGSLFALLNSLDSSLHMQTKKPN